MFLNTDRAADPLSVEAQSMAVPLYIAAPDTASGAGVEPNTAASLASHIVRTVLAAVAATVQTILIHAFH